ncbi:MAG: HDOD domain-containing protein [Paucibacter sp.]|nr:HDOD domain-containing protein [Roseateles sp.]
MLKPELQHLIAGIRDLPTPNAVVIDLLNSLADEHLSGEQLARKISQDQAIAAKLLRLANTSFFGLSRQVTSISDAVAIVGLRSVRNIALTAGLMSSFDAGRCQGFELEAFWRHSLACALGAEALAVSLRMDGGMAFGTGLLHDMGRMALACALPEAYAEVLRVCGEKDLPLLEVEQTLMGTDHGEFGAALGEHWQLARPLIDAMALHHQPPEQTPSAWVDLVNVADGMAHGLGLDGLADEAVAALSLGSWKRLSLADEEVLKAFASVEAQHIELCQSLFTQEALSHVN